jgi:hypothetical protein
MSGATRTEHRGELESYLEDFIGHVKDFGFCPRINGTLEIFKRQKQEICFLK